MYGVAGATYTKLVTLPPFWLSRVSPGPGVSG
jgi:hypothetical protein